ncbi:MAG: lytic transglycosylase domain-containing protein [Nitrospirota bacterium]
MALPVALAALFAVLGAVLESEAPGAQEPIPHEMFCCISRAVDASSNDSGAASIPSAFRVVYTRTESRVVQVDRVLQAIGSDDLGPSQRRHLGGVLAGLSDHYGYDPALIVAVIMTESSFDPSSRSHKGALGLMQLLPNTAEQLAQETNRPWSGEHALFDPTYNISLGVRYLAQLQKRFGSLDVALAAYNYGPYRVEELIRRGKPVPMDYTKRVLARYEEVRAAERLARL